jgi:formylglycine-generating enzyme required for sulfatase activity
MNLNRATILILILLTVMIGLIVGCSDEEDIVGPASQTGTIGISIIPDTLNAPWDLVGPDGYTKSGTGDDLLSNIPVGDYILTMGEVEGWVRPAEPITRTLGANAINWFQNITYVEVSDPGTVVIDINPDELSVDWELQLPNGTFETGIGDTVLVDMPIGEYILDCGQQAGYHPVDVESEILLPAGEITFNIEYEILNNQASLIISVNPSYLEAQWTLTNPDTIITGVGETTLYDMSWGIYDLEWEPIQDWKSPYPNPNRIRHVTTEANPTTEVVGEYLNMYAVIDPGSFEMGDVADIFGQEDEQPVHTVSISGSFEIGTSEVTQEEFEAVMGYNPSSNQDNYSYPVTNVSWYDAIDYCIALSNAEGRVSVYSREGSEITWNDSANGYRLPTEAEWEFVCRANGGSGNSYCYGDDTDDLYHYAWYNTTLHITRDGDKFPNDFGVYGMHGNVWEWCWDWYGDYSSNSQSDPRGPADGQWRVVRGGSIDNSAADCRNSIRGTPMPNSSSSFMGFRVIRAIN